MKNQRNIRSLTIAGVVVVGIAVAACGDPDAQTVLPAADQAEVMRPHVVQLMPADRLQEQFDPSSINISGRDTNSQPFDALNAAFTERAEKARTETARAETARANFDRAIAAQADAHVDQAEEQRHARLAATADLDEHAEAQADTEDSVTDGLSRGHYIR